MQSLSIWPYQGDVLKLPQFEFQFSCNFFGCIRRNGRSRKLEFCVSSNYLVQNVKVVYNRSLYGSLRSGCFLGCSEIKPALFSDHKRLLGLCSPIGWSLGEQPIGDDVDKESRNNRVDLYNGELPLSESVEESKERFNTALEEALGGNLGKGELPLSENVCSNVGEESTERVDIVLEETIRDTLQKGELPLSLNGGTCVDEDSKDRIDTVLEETIGGNLKNGVFPLVENVGSDIEESKERVDIVLEETLGDNLLKGELPLSENVNDDDIIVEARDNSEVEGEETVKVDVSLLSRSLRLAKSVEDVEQVLKDEVRLPLQVFCSIIRTFGREKRLEAAMAVVAWLKEKHKEDEEFDGPNLFIYNSLLGAVKQSKEFGRVEEIMNDISNAGFSPSVVTYNTLMGIYVDAGREPEALNLFEIMQQKGLPLSPSSFSTAVLAYRKMEDADGALRLFVGMRDKYMNGELQNCDNEDWEIEFWKLKNFTSRVCYQVMRRWLVERSNSTTKVLKLLIEMDKLRVPPSNSEYERLIWACTREEHYTVAKELYKRIRERSADISLSVCNHIIWLMGKAKKWWAALEVYEDLLELGPKPNSMSFELIASHFNILLSSARKRGIWKWGVQLLDKMEAKGLKPRSREWNAVLIACSKAAETDAAIDIFKKMVNKGEKPNEVSYGALLSALEKGKMYDEAVRVWEHMRKVGIEVKPYTYTIMASVYVGLGKFNLVEYIIQEMISTGNDPTVITFNAIISVCSRNGLGGEAYEWFQRMKPMNIDPNEVTYEMLILSLAKDGKPRLAFDFYLRALNEGLALSYKAYDAVIRSSQDCGVTIDVIALGPRPAYPKKNWVTTNNLSMPDSVAKSRMRGKSFDEEGHAEQSRKNP